MFDFEFVNRHDYQLGNSGQRFDPDSVVVGIIKMDADFAAVAFIYGAVLGDDAVAGKSGAWANLKFEVTAEVTSEQAKVSVFDFDANSGGDFDSVLLVGDIDFDPIHGVRNLLDVWL